MAPIITFTGPESCGKSTLSMEYATHCKGNWIAEYSREYLQSNGLQYTEKDVINMAKSHSMLIRNAKKSQHMAILDTDLLTYLIWFRFKFGYDSEQLNALWLENPADYYLICHPDLPWEYDPMRENPNDRHLLVAAYRELIHERRIPFDIVTGWGRRRFFKASLLIDLFQQTQ